MKQQVNLTSCDNMQSDYKKLYILLVKDFASSITTKEQLIQIFKQSNIKVIFLKDIIENVNTKIQENINEDNINVLKEKVIKLEEENMMLKEKLKQYKNN
jgi:adenine/guanine phosphoribosyltransferase-like PRPP-binding protein